MKVSAGNYTPQSVVRENKKQAVKLWGAALFLVFLWLAFIIAAPMVKISGLEGFADSIYKFFSYVCHQISERSFHVGEHPFAVCTRCFGFYAGFFLGFIIYSFFRRLDDIESFPRIWLFLAIIPMAIDWSLGFFEIWENASLSRAMTGGILGFACAFFIVPALAEISRWFIERKIKRLSR
jgi:uncharacterized membrane protein